MKKRKFLKGMGAATALLFADPFEALGQAVMIPGTTKKTALVLGGRGFIGPSIVQSLLANGYEVTLLNRNKTNTHLFNNLPLIVCDREKEDKAGLKSIDSKYGKTYWDVVVDTWQKSPKAVSDFLDEFKDQIGHYHYISTVSVYDKWDKKFIVETEPLNPLPNFPKTIKEEYRYAIRKTLAEEAIRERITNYTIYRSHGMRDFRSSNPKKLIDEPFWPIRFYRGGEILLPNVKNHHMQMTDVKSMVDFIIHCSNHKVFGEYNIACRPTLFKDYVSSLIHATKKPEKLHWIDGDFLIENGLIPYKVVPFWRTQPQGSYYFNVQKAIEAGFEHRPLVDVITDQINGYRYRHPNDDVRFGKQANGTMKCYSPDQEKDIIKKWKLKNGID
nr:NAD-dependent epimerase/dehydratase family protein [uncultured Allomuricauda sp.]